MNDWTAGYVADIGYTYGYYAELNPQRMKLPLLYTGLVAPDVQIACELGFGQGLSTNIHAAAARVEWHGTDFNPSQAGFAQELASVSGAPAKLRDDAFADFCVRPDLPDFDFIGLHGIWSWISHANREVIVDFVRRKLKVGGVLYISYNTMPGWAPMVPVRALLTEHTEVMGAQGQGIVGRIDAALAFAQKLMATNPAYARTNPKVVDRINQINEQNRNYVAHEYFNQDWLPMSFADMARWLTPAKLDYACSAHYLDHVDEVNLSQDQRALLADIQDSMFRETVRDFMVGQQFRRDYWVKGARRMTGFERIEKMRAQKVVLTSAASEITFKAVGAAGEAQLTENVYRPLIDLLADHKPRTMHQIE